MDRRSPPQKRTDDHAFPVRVKILVPERGFEDLLLDVQALEDRRSCVVGGLYQRGAEVGSNCCSGSTMGRVG